MATYYFDSVAGSDSTGDGSLGNPWATYNAKKGSTTTGDRCLFKRGTQQVISTIYLALRSGTSLAKPFYMGAYGTGANPVFSSPTHPWAYILDGSNLSWVTIEDLDFDNGNAVSSAIYIAGEGTGTCEGWRIRRCRFYGSSTINGVTVRKAVSATTAICRNHIFEDCEFFNNGSSGVIVTAATGVIFRRCKAWNNGFAGASGGHGISFAWNRTNVTSGWTSVSGTIYKRTLEAAATDVTYVSAPSPNLKMTKNTGTPTSPASGEFGVSGGELYINIGSNPSGVAISYAWGRCGDNVVEDCIAWDNKPSPTWTYTEGHGFAFDDFTEDSVFRRCRSFSNTGLGFSINKGDRNTIQSCLAYDNGLNGISVTAAADLTIKNNTLVKNNQGSKLEPTGMDSEINITDDCANTAVSQTVIIGKSGLTYGVKDDALATSTTIDLCSISGVTSEAKTVTPTNTISGDPLLDSTYAPKVGSPLLNAGAHEKYSRSIDGKLRPNTPAIGAYEYYTPRSDASTRGTR